ncbi:zinc finger protein OZF-like [Hetaerina americana]|uniref:zinc finger protein OZF-like n=1 Tax=Hetaerina americana TaxID=62018 RepID=UPI003A7F1193
MFDKAEFEVCRLCLSSRGLLINVFSENSKLQIMLKNTIEDLIDVKVVQDANYSWLVCPNCMEKLTEFRLFKRRCAECLSVYNDRIQKGCNPAAIDCIINREEFPRKEIKKEIDDYTIVRGTVDSSAVDVRDDMINVKEEVDIASGCSASLARDIDWSMVSSMQEGCSHWSDSEEAENLDYSKYVEIHFSSDVEVDNKEQCDAGMAQDEGGLRGEVLQAQDIGKKEDGAGKDAADTSLHTCQICSKVFAQRYIKAHMMHVHMKKKMQSRCNICLEVFECKKNLVRHLQLVHTLKKKHQCQQCSRNFHNPKELRNHMPTHTGEWPFKCSICLKGFAQKKDLQRHILTHTGEKPHKCVICSKAFSLKGNLRQHILTHSDERRHKCAICSKAFTSNGHLKEHMLTHTGDRLFKCMICQKAFTQNSNLKIHMLTHTSEKPYKCLICSKAFKLNGNLKIHILTHTNERPHKCDICSKAFTQHGALKRHMLTHTTVKS